VTVTVLEFEEENGRITLNLNANQKKDFFCKSTVFITTTNIHEFTMMILPGSKTITLENLTAYDFLEIKFNGLKIFKFCHGFFQTISDFMKYGIMNTDFKKGNLVDTILSPILHSSEKKFLEDQGFFFIERNRSLPTVDPNYIKSGDLFTAFTFKGTQTFITFGSGARVGHNAMAMWIDNELYVLEAEGHPFGIHKTKWKDWYEEVTSDDYSIAYHPLKEELRNKFNTTAALNFFKTVERFIISLL
jgi:hypothetical protein